MPYFITVAAMCIINFIYSRWRDSTRGDFIRTYMFPPSLLGKFAKKHGNIGVKEQQLAARVLRQFFLAYLKGERKRVAMPSQAADELWHEFFCIENIILP